MGRTMSDRLSAEEHTKRMARGVGAVRDYLQAQFPGHVVEVLEPSDRDHSRDIRSFKILKDGETKYRVRVTDEVLDWDAAGVKGHLERFRVGQALRAAGPGKAVLVTTDRISPEPV